MNVSAASGKAHETDSAEEIVDADDDPIAELIERCFGVRGVRLENYLDVQHVFGWDDTH